MNFAMSPRTSWAKRADLALVLTAVTVALFAYLPTLNFPFVFDDGAHLTRNPKLLNLPATELWRLFVQPFNAFREFLPLRELSFWVDFKLFGLSPAAFRAHNIALYLLSLPLVYLITDSLWRQFKPEQAHDSAWVAATVTALFAIHPALVESVVWITGRKYVLPNLLSLLAIWLAMRARQAQGLSWQYALATVCVFTLVMLTKTTYFTVAPLISMIWFLHWRNLKVQSRRIDDLLWSLLIMMLAAVLVLIFMSMAFGGSSSPYRFDKEALTRPLACLGWLTRLAITGEDRHLYYRVFEDPNFIVMVGFGGVILAVCLRGVTLLLRRRSLVGFALAAYLILCVPYLQILPISSPSVVQDRYLSLAVFPLLFLLVVLAWRLPPLPRIVVLLLFALPWGFQTVTRARDWSSFEKIVIADQIAYPGYFFPAAIRILTNLLPQGMYLDALETAKSVSEAIPRELLVELVNTAYSVKLVLDSRGDSQAAMTRLWNLGVSLNQRPASMRANSTYDLIWGHSRNFVTALWTNLAEKLPGNPNVRYNTGLWMLSENWVEESIQHFHAAAYSSNLNDSDRAAAFKKLGFALLSLARYSESEAAYRNSISLTPGDGMAYCGVLEVLKKSGRLAEAANLLSNCPS